MALKVLSGILKPRFPFQGSGSVQLVFSNWTDGSLGNADLADARTTGASGGFDNLPGKVISLREFRVLDNSFFQPPNIDFFRINDSGLTQDTLTVSWSTSPGGAIIEMSVLIVGET